MEQRVPRTSNRRGASGKAQTSQQPTQNNQSTPTEKASQAPSNAQPNQTAEVKNGSPAAPVKQEQPKQQSAPQKESTQRDGQQDQQVKNTNQRNNRRSNNARPAATQSAPSHQYAEAPTQPAQVQLQVVGESQQKQLEEQQEVQRSLMAYSPVTWSIDQVATWLECMGFRYRKQVKRNHIDGIELLDLSIEDLEKMEIWSVGHRKKIMRAIEQLKQISTQYNVIAHAAHNVQPAAPQITVQKATHQQSTQQPAQAQHNHRQAAPQQQHQRNDNRNQVQDNNNNNYEGEDDGRRPRGRNYRGGRNTRNYYSSNRNNE